MYSKEPKWRYRGWFEIPNTWRGAQERSRASVVPVPVNDLQQRIQDVLRNETLTAIEIARRCGLQRASDVNPSLYRLKEQGLVHFDQAAKNVKPLWSLRTWFTISEYQWRSQCDLGEVSKSHAVTRTVLAVVFVTAFLRVATGDQRTQLTKWTRASKAIFVIQRSTIGNINMCQQIPVSCFTKVHSESQFESILNLQETNGLMMFYDSISTNPCHWQALELSTFSTAAMSASILACEVGRGPLEATTSCSNIIGCTCG